MPTNYQEPIEQKDLEIGKKVLEGNIGKDESILIDTEKKKIIPASESGKEIAGEKPEEKISEKIETVRKAIVTQPAQSTVSVSDDAQSVSQIQEFEKKVEKLVEIAVQKGPEHAIRVAQHMDKGKDPAMADNYTIDEIHDRLVEDELRSQLVAKGLLREL
jgi:hypothetical protein